VSGDKLAVVQRSRGEWSTNGAFSFRVICQAENSDKWTWRAQFALVLYARAAASLERGQKERQTMVVVCQKGATDKLRWSKSSRQRQTERGQKGEEVEEEKHDI